MKCSCENNVLTIFAEGRIDSANASEKGNELCSIINEAPHGSLILDFEKLEFISSAGLRVILKIRKNEPDIKIVNASAEVYEILDMTGFTEMLPVEKAYRQYSVEGCELIGRGAVGTVYRLDSDTVIKCYNNPDSLPDIRRERELARKAFVLGIPTAISYDVVKVGDGYGSVFELLNAKPVAQFIAEEPECFGKYVTIYTDLLKKLHSTQVRDGEMPDMKADAVTLADEISGELPAECSEKLGRLIAELPKKNSMIHGDYHLRNVLIMNGEAILIDMDTVGIGHPIFDLAPAYMAYVGYGEENPLSVENFLGIPYKTANRIWDTMLRLYFSTDDDAFLRDIKNKVMLLAYALNIRYLIRSGEILTDSGRHEADVSCRHVTELLDCVDTLDFE